MSCGCCKFCGCSIQGLSTFPSQIQDLQPLFDILFSVINVKLRREELLITLLAIAEEHKKKPFKPDEKSTKEIFKTFLLLAVSFHSYHQGWRQKFEQLLSGEEEKAFLMRMYLPVIQRCCEKLSVYFLAQKYIPMLKNLYTVSRNQKIPQYKLYKVEGAVLLFFLKDSSKYNVQDMALSVFTYAMIDCLGIQWEGQETLNELFSGAHKSENYQIAAQLVSELRAIEKSGQIDNILIDRQKDIQIQNLNKLLEKCQKEMRKGSMQREDLQSKF